MKSDASRAIRPAVAIGVSLVAAWLLLGTQQYMNFLTLGAIYALIALGYTLVYGIIELINFAHGDVFMVSSFLAMWILTNLLGLTGPINEPVKLAAVLLFVTLVTMVAMGLLNVIIERVAYRPLRTAPRLAPLLTAIGVSFILGNVIYSLFGPSPQHFPAIFPLARFDLLGGKISFLSLFIIAAALTQMVGLHLFISRTRLGLAMRSTAQNRETAQLMGIDIDQTIAITFFLAAALAGSAGVIEGLYFGSIQFNLGYFAGLKAFTAAVLGGIGNTIGALIGGFVIAFIEVFVTVIGLSRWIGFAVFAVLILILVFRPNGILGQAPGERV